MNEIIQERATSTIAPFGTIIQNSALSATTAIMAMTAMMAVDDVPRKNPTPAYSTFHDAPTFSFSEGTLYLSEVSDMQKFAQEIASIYADLAARQKPLGREFDVVWSENIDQLYES